MTSTPEHEAPATPGVGSKALAWITGKEPVIAGGLVTAAGGAVGTFLVAHGLTDANTIVQSAEPVVTAGLVLLIAWLVRHWVTPAANAVDKHT